MIPGDYETITVRRATAGMVDGVRTVGEPEMIGELGMLVAPGDYERENDIGRRVVTHGADLYRRGPLPFDIRPGDLVDVRGLTLTVTGTPKQWRRGGRTVGVELHAEQGKDTP